MATRKYSIIVTNGQLYEVWGQLTDICEAHKLPYHTLKKEGFPFDFKEFKFIKVEDSKKIIP